jgi:hypothetical protein
MEAFHGCRDVTRSADAVADGTRVPMRTVRTRRRKCLTVMGFLMAAIRQSFVSISFTFLGRTAV